MEFTTDAAHIIGECSANRRRKLAQIGYQPLPRTWYVCTIIDRTLNSREPLP
jgi:hypothetical protein